MTFGPIVSRNVLFNVGRIFFIYSHTVDEEHALLLFSRRSENSDWILQ